MNNTMEKTTNDSMSGMMNSSFFGEFDKNADEPIKKECAIKGLICGRINLLDEEIEEAHKEFSVAFHNERYSQKTYEADEKCKMLKAQKDVLVLVQRDIEDMLTPNDNSVMPMSA